jgi:hypothetical protein
VKVLVFDFDIYLFERFLPDLRWILDIRIFILFAAIAVLWLYLGSKKFLAFIGYVIGYPLVLLFWKVPKYFFHHWHFIVIFAPAIYSAGYKLRSTFLLYAVAISASFVITISSEKQYLYPSMAFLGCFIVVHLYWSLKEAYSAGLFSTLSNTTRDLRIKMKEWFPFKDKATTSPETKQTTFDPLMSLYLFHWLAEFIAEKVQIVAKGRKYDIFLVLSWFYTVVLTSMVFSFEYWAIYKISPASFTNDTAAGFWNFVGYSIGILTTAGLSPIEAVSSLASIISYVEVFCSILILIIFAFSILTAAREAFQEGLQDFNKELHLIAEEFEKHANLVYKLTVDQVEVNILVRNEPLVNYLRKARGLPKLPFP